MTTPDYHFTVVSKSSKWSGNDLGKNVATGWWVGGDGFVYLRLQQVTCGPAGLQCVWDTMQHVSWYAMQCTQRPSAQWEWPAGLGSH